MTKPSSSEPFSRRSSISPRGSSSHLGLIRSVELLGNVEIEGALFANTISDMGNLRLTFARPTHGPDGKKCVPPPSTSPGPADDPKPIPPPVLPGGDPDFDDGTPGGKDPGTPEKDKPGFDDGTPDGTDPPPNKDGLPDPADLPLVK